MLLIELTVTVVSKPYRAVDWQTLKNTLLSAHVITGYDPAVPVERIDDQVSLHLRWVPYWPYQPIEKLGGTSAKF